MTLKVKRVGAVCTIKKLQYPPVLIPNALEGDPRNVTLLKLSGMEKNFAIDSADRVLGGGLSQRNVAASPRVIEKVTFTL